MRDKEDKGQITIFASFNHEAKHFVDSLSKKLPQNVTLLRYEDSLGEWDSFKDFMNSIKEQDFAVLVISDAYLKSRACMYEVLQQTAKSDWRERTMFAVMPDANIYAVGKRVEYIKFWAKQYEDLEKQVTGVPESATLNIRKDVEEIGVIRDSIGSFLDVVSDSKNPPIYTVIDEICKRVDISSRTRFQTLLKDGQIVSTKSWVVLAVIKENPTITLREIANKTGLSVHTVSHIVKDLVEDGLVTADQGMVTVGNAKRMVNLYSA